jgi:hypothetical protein
MQMCTGYMIAAARYPVTKLGVAESVAEYPQPVSKLAEQRGANEDGLYRYCVRWPVLESSPKSRRARLDFRRLPACFVRTLLVPCATWFSG